MLLSGDTAVAYGVKLARARLIPGYPITPQTPILEKLSELAGSGELDAEIMTVESEHTAMAACIGGSMGGVRVFTATASQGLFYMHEMLHWAAGARAPIVMVNVNRSPAAPWGFWSDHTDSLAQRDTGWVQLYCETPQEALDTVLQAYRIAESADLPVMVNIEAVYVSHTYEPVAVPDPAAADAYLPPFAAPFRMDVRDPVNYGPPVSADTWFAQRCRLDGAMGQVPELARQADREWAALTGRGYGLVEAYRMDGAGLAVVTVGGVAGTAREAVDALRGAGMPVGLARVRLVRPVPVDDLRRVLGGVADVCVIDRNCSPGLGGIVCQEVRAALYGLPGAPRVHGFIAGAGGRNISVEDVAAMARSAAAGAADPAPAWYGGAR